jgi:ABC-2 type transport system permease protein
MKRSFKRIAAIASKEWLQITRDVRSLILALITPSMLILLFGYALTTDVKHVRIAVFDQDRSPRSRDFIERFSHTEYFDIAAFIDRYDAIDSLFDHSDISLAVVIPTRFERDLDSGRTAPIQLIADGSDSTSASVAMGYVGAIALDYSASIASERALKRGITPRLSGIQVEQRFWYNQTMESKNYILPGLIALILAIICALIASLTISRENERGTLETLLSTPLRPYETVIGKLIPYLLIGLFDSITAVSLGYFLFGFPLNGSFTELIAISLLFLAGMSGLGILISTATRIQVLSVQVSMVVTYLPTFILSGFIFPISNMPVFVQGITYLIPAKYLIVVLKGIALKGIGSSLLFTQIVFLAVFCTVVFFAAIRKFGSLYPYRRKRHA